MTLDEFTRTLTLMGQRCREFTSLYVTQLLPSETRFWFAAVRLADANGRVKFINRQTVHKRSLVDLNAEKAASMMYIDGKFPSWVNLSISGIVSGCTNVEICVSRVLVDHQTIGPIPDGVPPFHVRGPSIPPGWRSVELDGKFDLDWMQNSQKLRQI